MKNRYTSFSRGAQYNNGKSSTLALILFFFLILISILWSDGMLVETVFLICVSIILYFYMIDVRGVDVDQVKKRIRRYEINVWGKTGRWKGYENFVAVSLKYDSYRTKEDFIVGTHEPSSVNVVNRRFLVSIMNNNPKKSIVILESEEYWEARKQAIEAAKKLNLIFIDQHHENTIRMQKTRRR